MSKYMVWDFRCLDCNQVAEHYAKPDQAVSCPQCNGKTKRLISAPRIEITGKDPDFGTAYDKWERINKQKTAQDKAFYDRHGVNKMHHSYGS